MKTSKPSFAYGEKDFYDPDSPFKDFEFTRKAVHRMNSVINSVEFEEMDSDTIFAYLYKGMDLVSFKDYLKRYIYEKSEIQEPFPDVDDNDYKKIIIDCFRENSAPFSFEATAKKPSAIVKAWLSHENVKRTTVFVLGFGLRMSREDVSEFLTKVIRENDFDLTNPDEVIYCYCFEHHLPYSAVRRLSEEYDHYRQQNHVPAAKLSEASTSVPENEDELFSFLAKLEEPNDSAKKKMEIYMEFCRLYDRARYLAASIFNNDKDLLKEKDRYWNMEDITSGDLEKIISSGIPMEKTEILKR